MYPVQHHAIYPCPTPYTILDNGRLCSNYPIIQLQLPAISITIAICHYNITACEQCLGSGLITQ